MTTEQALGIVSGLSLTALLVIALTTIPAWIPFAIIIGLSALLTGFDSTIEEQQLGAIYKRQEMANQSSETTTGHVQSNDTEKLKTARQSYLKNQAYDNEPKRVELLKDLKTIGVDVGRFNGMNYKQIMQDLFKHEKSELEKLRSFLK